MVLQFFLLGRIYVPSVLFYRPDRDHSVPCHGGSSNRYFPPASTSLLPFVSRLSTNDRNLNGCLITIARIGAVQHKGTFLTFLASYMQPDPTRALSHTDKDNGLQVGFRCTVMRVSFYRKIQRKIEYYHPRVSYTELLHRHYISRYW